jgi:hypothetical protein
MFDPSVFMSVFADHGLALRAYRTAMPNDVGFLVGFVQPEQLILGESVHTSQVEIEYATAMAPALVLGTELSINGVAYRVQQVPRKQGDGTFTRALLEEKRA